MKCAICKDFSCKDFKAYKAHYARLHNTQVTQTNKIQPVRTSGRLKMEIVRDFEAQIFPHIITADGFEWVYSMNDGDKDVHFYKIQMYGHPMNGHTVSTEYLTQLDLIQGGR